MTSARCIHLKDATPKGDSIFSHGKGDAADFVPLIKHVWEFVPQSLRIGEGRRRLSET